MTRLGRVVRAVWPPLVFGIAFLALWEAAVNVFDWKPYFLPKPSSIWTQFTDNLSSIRAAAAVSGANALVAGSAVFKGGTLEAYKTNISAIRNAAALARGEAV